MARSVHIAEANRPVRASSMAKVRVVLAMALLAAALAVVVGARAQLTPPPITIGSITVDSGTAVVTGVVDDVNAVVNVNEVPVNVDQSGDFVAVVDLEGEPTLVLSLLNSAGEAITIRIPVAVLNSSGSEGILNDLVDAGISVEVPIDGFTIVDGQMPIVSGNVVNADRLASLTVNGIQVLDNLSPSGAFAIVPPSGSQPPQHVTVVAIDRRGVSQTSTFPLRSISSVIATVAGASVSAAGAQGVVIAKVRFDTSKLRANKRLGVTVTVKDRRGFLIRGAALRLNGMPLRYLANGSVRAGFTNRVGQAKFWYRLHTRAFARPAGKRLAVMANASTPRASARRKVQLRLPTLARR